jgi:hypothetical protein
MNLFSAGHSTISNTSRAVNTLEIEPQEIENERPISAF